MTVTLHLTNWKCHTDLTIELGSQLGADLVVGYNGSGKSALNDAIEFVLLGTGKLSGIHTKADLGALVISDGAEECSVIMTLGLGADLWSVKRDMDRSGKQSLVMVKRGPPIEGKLREQQQRLDEWLGVEESQVRAVLDARVLLEGPEAARKAVLFGATGHQATESQIVECFAKLDLEGGDVRQAAQDVVRSGWRAAEDLAKERRVTQNRKLADMHEPTPEHLFRHSALETGADPIDLRKASVSALERIRTTNQKTLAEVTRGAGLNVGRAEEAVRTKDQERITLETDSTALMAEADAVGYVSMAGLKLAESNAKSEVAEAKMARDACVESRKKLGKLIDVGNIQKPNICPAIPGEFECPVTKSRLEKHRDKLALDAENLTADLEIADHEVNQSSQRYGVAAVAYAKAEAAVNHETLRIQSLGRTHDRIETIDRELVELNNKLEKAKSNTATEKEVAFAQRRFDATLETIEARKRLDTETAALETYERDRATVEDARDRCDQIAQALKPTGIETTLLAGLIDPLQKRIDAVAGHLGEMRITSSLDIEMKWNGVWRRYQQLSESTRERMAIAVQHAVASLVGFPILIIDRVDHLDAPGKGACLRALVSVAQNYQAVLALATLQTKKPTKVNLAGVTTWYLTGTEEAVARVE